MINPAHKLAVFEYNENVDDKYYVGKRFISSYNPDEPGDPVTCRTFVVATADTTEELQPYLDHSPEALVGWLVHQQQQLHGIFGGVDQTALEDAVTLARLFG